MRKTSFDPDRLDDAGWGVITPIGSDPNLAASRLHALAELMKWREARTYERFKKLEVRPQESAAAFLARHGLRPGFSDPDRLPYYLLIAASPEEIPFSFQVGLGDYLRRRAPVVRRSAKLPHLCATAGGIRAPPGGAQASADLLRTRQPGR